MTARPPPSGGAAPAAPAEAAPNPLEQRIAEALAAAGFRLRRDRVALRLLTGVQAGMAAALPPDQTIILAIAAPIRHPAKTLAALIQRLPNLPPGGLRATVHGNTVDARKVRRVLPGAPAVLGVVYTPGGDVGGLLEVVEGCLGGG